MNKTLKITLGTMALVAALVVAGVGVRAVWAQGPWGRYGSPAGPGMMGGGWQGGSWGPAQGGWCGGYTAPGSGAVESLEDAKGAVEQYLQDRGYTGLEVEEVMEFERNYYAIAEEEDTGIGAFEVLVDKSSGAVWPEPGPNMMWNAKYGMMGRGGMMGPWGSTWSSARSEMSVTPAEAEKFAQEWLDAKFPGRTTGEADAFYGYYTFHFLKDGQIEGMLSVDGSTGAVWYHS